MKKNYYITNAEILPWIWQYQETGIISEELGEILLLIARNYASKGSFFAYTWKEDMISEAVLTLVKYLGNFQPIGQKSPNPFSYFTVVVHRAFLTYLRKQKKHSDIKTELYDNFVEDEIPFDIQGINYEEFKIK